MFKFNFSTEDEEKDIAEDILESESKVMEAWYPAELMTFELKDYEKAVNRFVNTKTINVNNLSLKIRKREEALVAIRVDPTVAQHTALADSAHSDLIPAKYEGGLKIWECTYDLLNYLSEDNSNDWLLDKDVADFGCGAGLLGLVCLNKGAASVTFQDYNSEVLKHWTFVNVALQGPELWKKCQFWSGDWGDFSDSSNSKYDVILMSETIYNPAAYLKLIKIINTKLKSDGFVLLAAKSYYFGLGGSIKSFEAELRKESHFNIKTVFKFSEGVQREILEIRYS